MGWNPNAHRMTGQVHIHDIRDAVQVDSLHLGELIKTGVINKWAKWKPVRSTAVSLKTVESRQVAGRVSATDYERQFGVYAPGVGNIITLDQIHDCKFEYERPINGYLFRMRDFVHPTLPNSYGYRDNAHFDIVGQVFPTESEMIVIPVHDIGMEIEINYNPISNEEKNEMLSIADFMTNGVLEYDPLQCYPCVLITQGLNHYIRGLYKQNGNAPATIGVTGPQMWRLNCNDAPAGWRTDSPATLSVFLVSQKIILHGTPNWDITNWITIPDQQSESAWEAWFFPIPDVTGLDAYIGVAPMSILVKLRGARYNEPRDTGLQVFWSVVNPQMTADFDLVVSMGGDTARVTLPIRGNTVNGTTVLNLATYFPSTLFIPGVESTYNVQIIYTPTQTVIDEKNYTLTY